MPEPLERAEELAERAIAWSREHWHGFVVALAAAYAFLVRMRPYEAYKTADGTFFIGTDPYYHARHVRYTVENFPSTLQYDPLTQYPIGTDPGQFGTLFDQVGAALAWLFGLVVDGGHPSPDTFMAAFVSYPAILGGLTVVAIYLLARQLVDRGPALYAAIVAAILPGEFLVRSLAGYVDHHVMEALLSTLAVAAYLWAMRAWQESQLTLAGLVEQPRDLLEPAYRSAWTRTVLAALAFTAYLWTWPSGVLFIGILGLWTVIQAPIEIARGRELAPLLLPAVGTFLLVALAMVFHVDRSGFTAINYSWMQPIAAVGLALGAAGLGALALVWRDRGLDRRLYPLAVAGSLAAGILILWLLVPQLIDQTLSGLSWITGVGVRRTRLTIAEAQPATMAEMSGEFGFLFWSAAMGLALVAWSAIWREKPTDTLLILWAVLMTTATFTQARFLYYLAVVVALLNGELAHHLFNIARGWRKELDASGTKGTRSSQEAEGLGTTGTVFVVALLVLAAVPVHATGWDEQCRGDVNSWSLAGCFGPGEERLWRNGLVWMNENTPAIPLSLGTQFDAPPRGERFDYPPGTYGVLSWWDYGHQIEFEAERPPIANPFQQQAPLASRIFTNATEAGALSILDDYLGQGNTARYVVIDDQMVSTKFGAITIWAGVNGVYNRGGTDTFRHPESGQPIRLPVIGDTVEDWFLIELYYSDGSGHEHFRLVHDSHAMAYIGNRGALQNGEFRLHNYNTILGRAGTQDTIESFGSLNFRSGENLVPSGGNRWSYDVRVAPALKIYERVPGATLTGTTTPGATVTAALELENTVTGRPVTYQQTTEAGPQGSFEITVPYSTTAPVGPEAGGTNSDVLAQGPYTLSSGNATTTVDVPDRVVLDGGTINVGFT